MNRQAKQAEAEQWKAEHEPEAPMPRLIGAVLKGEPVPPEPLEFDQ